MAYMGILLWHAQSHLLSTEGRLYILDHVDQLRCRRRKHDGPATDFREVWGKCSRSQASGSPKP